MMSRKPYKDKNTSLFHIRVRDFQVQLISEALDKHNGNVSEAAKDLGITRSTLYNIMKTNAKVEVIDYNWLFDEGDCG